MTGFPVKTTEIRRMRKLAESDLTAGQIATLTGREKTTVRRHCADIFAARRERERAARQILVEAIRALGAMEKGAQEIADGLGITVPMVWKLGAGALRSRGRKPDLARRRRIIAAAETAAHGDRGGLAARFGLKNVRTFNAALCASRKVLEARA